MGLKQVVRFIVNHPLNKDHKFNALLRFVTWQIRLRTASKPILYSFTDKAKLVVEKGMTGATGNLYCGLHEFNDMSFLLHFLRQGDTFADIGANVGSFTMLACAHVGANSLTFEPVPATFAKLKRNIEANKINDKVTAYNAAVGSEPGTIHFTNTMDTQNHVSKEGGSGTIEVPVMTLDQVTQTKPIPILMKVDVEGFETEVIKGASKTLEQEGVKAIIIELPGIGHRYGYDESKIHDRFLELGFRSYQYNPLDRSLLPVEQFGSYNTLYVRDPEFVNDRIKTAPKFKVLKREI